VWAQVAAEPYLTVTDSVTLKLMSADAGAFSTVAGN